VIALCQSYDHVTSKIPGIGFRERPFIGKLGAVVLLSLTAVAFGLYSPLAYGNPWTQSACNKVKLLDTWDWDCNAFHTDLSQYDTQSVFQNEVLSSTSAPPIPSSSPLPGVPAGQQQQPLAQDLPPMSEAPVLVSQAPPAPIGHSVVSREEKIEFRDQDGNLLDPEQVKALEGKVSFKTRYETRTRLVDAAGNEISPEDAGVAPPHPDIHNVDRETPGVPDPRKQNEPASQRDVTLDDAKEERIERSKSGKAQPASEGNEATA